MHFRHVPFRSLFIVCLLAVGCRAEPIDLDKLSRDASLVIKTGESLRTKLAITDQEQVKGLSGTLSSEWAADQAMLFLYAEVSEHRFWMPDTYFDLDIFFLDEDLKVLDVERGVKHHPGRTVPPEIATTRTIKAQNVLELRADSPLSKKIEIGHTLVWKSDTSLKAIYAAIPKRPKGY